MKKVTVKMGGIESTFDLEEEEDEMDGIAIGFSADDFEKLFMIKLADTVCEEHFAKIFKDNPVFIGVLPMVCHEAIYKTFEHMMKEGGKASGTKED